MRVSSVSLLLISIHRVHSRESGTRVQHYAAIDSTATHHNIFLLYLDSVQIQTEDSKSKITTPNDPRTIRRDTHPRCAMRVVSQEPTASGASESRQGKYEEGKKDGRDGGFI
jgi:hypothetical protein